jgi:hypothetical protein
MIMMYEQEHDDFNEQIERVADKNETCMICGKKYKLHIEYNDVFYIRNAIIFESGLYDDWEKNDSLNYHFCDECLKTKIEPLFQKTLLITNISEKNDKIVQENVILNKQVEDFKKSINIAIEYMEYSLNNGHIVGFQGVHNAVKILKDIIKK